MPLQGKSKSQAAFLTFCTFIGLGSLGLVISILNPDIGASAYLVTLLSPYAGIYYWNNAQRVDTVKVKMETADDEQLISVIAEGGKEG
jgi:Na+/citrate or Na+/malate symporter